MSFNSLSMEKNKERQGSNYSRNQGNDEIYKKYQELSFKELQKSLSQNYSNQQKTQYFQQLIKGGFIKCDKFYHFKKKVQKFSQHSISYSVKYGFFQTSITILFIDIHLEAFEKQIINRSQNGSIKRYQSQGESIIIKKINNEENNELMVSDSVLKEVFLTKFASCLQIGPHYMKKYGYDIVMSEKTSEFLMEEVIPFSIDKICSNCQKMRGIQKQIRILIKLLHSFHGVHCDIKPQNFGIKRNSNKIVLIDFGLSLFITELRNQYTLTKYRGTYYYSGSQMKKCFNLRQAMFINLYENDLDGIKTMLSQKSYSKQKINFFHQVVPKKHISEWHHVERAFRLKYFIFQNDFASVYQMIDEEDTLFLTFKKIIISDLISTKHPLPSKITDELLFLLNNKISDKFPNMQFQELLNSSPIDKILYAVYFKMSDFTDKINKCQPAQRNILQIIEMQKLHQIWGKTRWTQKIFEMIFKYPTKLFKQILGNQSGEGISMDLLEKFQKYFIQKQDIKHLQVVVNNHKLFLNQHKVIQINEVIKNICLEKKSQLKYLDLLGSFLIEILITLAPESTWEYQFAFSVSRQSLTPQNQLIVRLILVFNVLNLNLQKYCEQKILQCLDEIDSILSALKNILGETYFSKIHLFSIEDMIQTILSNRIAQLQFTNIKRFVPNRHSVEKASRIANILFKDRKYQPLIIRENFLKIYQHFDLNSMTESISLIKKFCENNLLIASDENCWLLILYLNDKDYQKIQRVLGKLFSVFRNNSFQNNSSYFYSFSRILVYLTQHTSCLTTLSTFFNFFKFQNPPNLLYQAIAFVSTLLKMYQFQINLTKNSHFCHKILTDILSKFLTFSSNSSPLFSQKQLYIIKFFESFLTLFALPHQQNNPSQILQFVQNFKIIISTPELKYFSQISFEYYSHLAQNIPALSDSTLISSLIHQSFIYHLNTFIFNNFFLHALLSDFISQNKYSQGLQFLIYFSLECSKLIHRTHINSLSIFRETIQSFIEKVPSFYLQQFALKLTPQQFHDINLMLYIIFIIFQRIHKETTKHTSQKIISLISKCFINRKFVLQSLCRFVGALLWRWRRKQRKKTLSQRRKMINLRGQTKQFYRQILCERLEQKKKMLFNSKKRITCQKKHWLIWKDYFQIKLKKFNFNINSKISPKK